MENERYLELVNEKKFRQLKHEITEENEVDIASFLEELPLEKAALTFRMLPKELAAQVFAHLSLEFQQYIVEAVTDKELSAIVEDLFIDDMVDFLEEVPSIVVKRVLRNAKEDTRHLINQFLQYPENSAGSVMTAEYVGIKKSITVKQAFEQIRKYGVDKETIYTCYVTDPNRILEGIVSVKTLLLSDEDTGIQDIMDENIISVTTTDDREEAAHVFSRYGLLSLPVVDHENRLCGIITIDDIVEVIEEEATEDFQKMAGLTPSEKPYLKTGVFSLAGNRIVWLLVLMFSAMITGGILESFQDAFVAMPLLVAFIPMLTDTGGNAGSQSSTLVIRGMAVGEIQLRDAFKVLRKELGVSVLVGIVLAAANFIRLYFFQYPGNMMVALTIALSLIVTVIIAKAIGGLLPLGAKLVRVDPAIMAAPIITTIVDAFALIVYLMIAKALLKL